MAKRILAYIKYSVILVTVFKLQLELQIF